MEEIDDSEEMGHDLFYETPVAESRLVTPGHTHPEEARLREQGFAREGERKNTAKTTSVHFRDYDEDRLNTPAESENRFARIGLNKLLAK